MINNNSFLVGVYPSQATGFISLTEETELLDSLEEASEVSPSGDEELVAKRRGNPLWKKGESGNPTGRPKGSKNRLTLLREAVLEEAEEMVLENWAALVQKTIELANAGDSTALKILWDRIIPARKAIDNDSADRKDFGIKIVVQGMDVKPTAIVDGDFTEEE